jgi:dihydroorotate dehydrogenase (NAD+) catalytic subunit
MTSVAVFGTTFRNPILLAAGTAGFGREIAAVTDLDALGGLVTKAVSLEPRHGNPAPRVAETAGAMLNSIGLANPGLDVVRAEMLPWLAAHGGALRVLVNVVGNSADDFVAVIRALDAVPPVSAFELNVSCPNTERGGIEFGADEDAMIDLVTRARAVTSRPLVVKLSPTLPDPARMASAAATAGADGFTCVNTLPALLFDEEEPHASRLGNRTGGLSGPPLLPVGLRMTELVARETGLPVIGAGGVRSGRDAWQYLAAGASLVAVGTAALADPRSPERIARELALILAAEPRAAPRETRSRAEVGHG